MGSLGARRRVIFDTNVTWGCYIARCVISSSSPLFLEVCHLFHRCFPTGSGVLYSRPPTRPRPGFKGGSSWGIFFLEGVLVFHLPHRSMTISEERTSSSSSSRAGKFPLSLVYLIFWFQEEGNHWSYSLVWYTNSLVGIMSSETGMRNVN